VSDARRTVTHWVSLGARFTNGKGTAREVGRNGIVCGKDDAVSCAFDRNRVTCKACLRWQYAEVRQ
jgi:hypothetical protein